MISTRLNTPLTIQKRQITTNLYGEEILEYTQHIKVYASKEYLKEEVKYISNNNHSIFYTKFRIRYNHTINTTMRLKHKDKHYEIKQIENISNKNRELFLYASETSSNV
jgi:SPP1 family predicted phage head-tail adaptor